MNKLWLRLYGSLVLLLWGEKMAIAMPLPSVTAESPSTEISTIRATPLAELLLSQPTANQLRQGEVLINLDTRSFFFPDLVESMVDDGDSAVNFNTGFRWGISDQLQLSLQFQHVDSSSPVLQGDFTSERTEDNEAALELKQRIWSSESGNQALSGVLGASWGTRGFMFSQDGSSTEINNRDVFVSLAFPFSTDIGDRWQVTFSPTVGFFNDDTAGFFRRLPDDNANSFGTVFGLGGGVTYRLNNQLSFVSDVFLPLTGNNSINRSSGDPDRAIAYSAGFRYLTNPQLALDLYATNTFASFAPLSLTADRDFLGLGANIVFLPDVFAANRQYGDRSNEQNNLESLTTDGLAFFDGGTLPSGKLAFNLQGGGQGVLTAVRYGLLKDFEVGIFLDYVSSSVDESEQGISGKVRLLNQQENAPLTLSLAGTASLTNEPFINFVNNDADTFAEEDLERTVPIFTPGGDDGDNGQLLIVTGSLPIQYEINTEAAVWFTPILAFVQREGFEIGGFNLGGSLVVAKEVSVIAEVGANFLGEGNSFNDGELTDEIPWTTAVRWQPLSLLGKSATADNSDPYLELYFTNRVGASTWHQLRVREDNDPAIGVGLFLPFNI